MATRVTQFISYCSFALSDCLLQLCSFPMPLRKRKRPHGDPFACDDSLIRVRNNKRRRFDWSPDSRLPNASTPHCEYITVPFSLESPPTALAASILRLLLVGETSERFFNLTLRFQSYKKNTVQRSSCEAFSSFLH